MRKWEKTWVRRSYDQSNLFGWTILLCKIRFQKARDHSISVSTSSSSILIFNFKSQIGLLYMFIFSSTWMKICISRMVMIFWDLIFKWEQHNWTIRLTMYRAVYFSHVHIELYFFHDNSHIYTCESIVYYEPLEDITQSYIFYSTVIPSEILIMTTKYHDD